jgi:CDP-glycerol glycerophosphotransferase
VAERAALRYKALRLARLAQNGGLGNARNHGLAQARGEWLWFFDADDYVPAGAFAGFDAQAACRGQDALVFEYRRRLAQAAPEAPMPDFDARLFAGRPGDVFTPREFPDIVTGTFAVWNKWFRRSLPQGLGLAFAPVQPGEDLLFVTACLTWAASIRFVPQPVCVYCEFQSTISKHRGARQLGMFEVFTEYDALLAGLDHPGLATAWRAAKLNILVYMARQVEDAAAPAMNQYLDACLAQLDPGAALALAASPVLLEGVKSRLALLKGVDPGLLGKAAAWFHGGRNK